MRPILCLVAALATTSLVASCTKDGDTAKSPPTPTPPCPDIRVFGSPTANPAPKEQATIEKFIASYGQNRFVVEKRLWSIGYPDRVFVRIPSELGSQLPRQARHMADRDENVGNPDGVQYFSWACRKDQGIIVTYLLNRDEKAAVTVGYFYIRILPGWRYDLLPENVEGF